MFSIGVGILVLTLLGALTYQFVVDFDEPVEDVTQDGETLSLAAPQDNASSSQQVQAAPDTVADEGQRTSQPVQNTNPSVLLVSSVARSRLHSARSVAIRSLSSLDSARFDVIESSDSNTPDPEISDALEHANNLVDDEEYDEAIAYLRPIVNAFPGNQELQFLLGDALYANEEIEEAIPHLERAGSSVDALLTLYSAQDEANRTADAEDTLLEYLERYPDSEYADWARRQLDE